jgi:hypothetical protein
MQKRKFIMYTGLLVVLLFFIGLLQSSTKNPYSYLSKPPINVQYIIKPDKAVYDSGEEIDYSVLITLDSEYCNPLCEYRVYFGDLKNLLKDSEMVDSEVSNFYRLNILNQNAVVTFKVKMVRRNNPPNIAVKAMRLAPADSKFKKRFLDIVIDEYSLLYITPPEYNKAKKSGYINPEF